ncbi:hypothetical protein FXF51_05815 [Nonomuraea sp. PA05]|uniref:hypothetical protein n=1 Tax=Nonomuraea sp. PA05 TaxID=2604466 RepID=UPI0011D78190|nr:hypothetical protein [Nonomuraea sp. PA05]TYB69676.1 hypothetical protein FXF51_05815 [Nonomuraea sp. PA05]
MGEVRHGTIRRYNAYRCRCTPCRAAKSRYDVNRRRLMAYGRWTAYGDAGFVRAHVAGLMARGLSPTAIADLAGVHAECVLQVLNEQHVRGPLDINARSLLAVSFDLDAIPDRVLIDATGTRRRVQALVAIGYSLSAQCALLGRTVNNYYKVLRNPRVFAETARAVRDLYRELSRTPAPPSRGAKLACRRAARNGWLSPLAWDDIDDPNEKPKGVRREAS